MEWSTPLDDRKCDVEGAPLEKRNDEDALTVKRRLAVYRDQTAAAGGVLRRARSAPVDRRRGADGRCQRAHVRRPARPVVRCLAVIIRKSPAELEKMRRLGRDPGRARSISVLAAVAPGRIDPRSRPRRRALHRSPRRGATSNFKGYQGAAYPGPGTICASINDRDRARDPLGHADACGGRPAVAGLRRDLGGLPRRFRGDRLRGRQSPSDDAKRLVETTRGGARGRDRRGPARRPALRHRPRHRAGGDRPTASGVVREYGGHGIGRAMHEDPFIQNWGRPDGVPS